MQPSHRRYRRVSHSARQSTSRPLTRRSAPCRHSRRQCLALVLELPNSGRRCAHVDVFHHIGDRRVVSTFSTTLVTVAVRCSGDAFCRRCCYFNLLIIARPFTLLLCRFSVGTCESEIFIQIWWTDQLSESECKCLTCNQKPTGSQFSLLHEPN